MRLFCALLPVVSGLVMPLGSPVIRSVAPAAPRRAVAPAPPKAVAATVEPPRRVAASIDASSLLSASLSWAIDHHGDDALLALASPAAHGLLADWRRTCYGSPVAQRVALDAARAQLLEFQTRAHVSCKIRSKGLWSTFLKSSVRRKSVHDVLAMRIVVRGGEQDCFRAHADALQLWPSVSGRYKDYVTSPKRNGYQAIHDTVMLPCGLPMEIQIRTKAMHRRAEYGSASHRLYKGSIGQLTTTMLGVVAGASAHIG
jgi:hypothetical protein